MQSTFTVPAREKSLQSAKAHLSKLVHPGDEILDLCCGSGFVAFWFEEQGAKVIAMDFAPYMIALAREGAAQRNSTVEFLEADIFMQDFGQERFDLISCFGNSISDFPISDFAKLEKKIARALKLGGRFILDYHDGSYDFMQGRGKREGVFQESPERITFHYKGYLPEIGARIHIIRNETRGEEYERKGYIYTIPVVSLALHDTLELSQHIALDENHYLDVFAKTAQA